MKNSDEVQSVRTALSILEIICESGQDLGLTGIAGRVGISKASVSRHLNTLVRCGFLALDTRSQRYKPSLKLHFLGVHAAERDSLLACAEPIMRDLRDKTGLTVNIAVFKEDSIQIIQSMLGSSAQEVRIRVGTELPYHATSQGRIGLAFNNDLYPIVLQPDKQRFTHATIVDTETLVHEIHRVREAGWSMAAEETRVGINALSVPVWGASGQNVAALSLVGLKHDLPKDPDPNQIHLLSGSANLISKCLGSASLERKR